MANDLVRISTTTVGNITKFDVRIQFVVDVKTSNEMLHFFQNGILVQAFGSVIVKSIEAKLTACWSFSPGGTGHTITIREPVPNGNDYYLNIRDPSYNPFQEQPFPNQYAVMAAPALPLIRFYVGEGASLTYDYSGNLAKALPGYKYSIAAKKSFFSRALKAGYLFTDGNTPVEDAFSHELGHVLGLEDRYIEGIDDGGSPSDKLVTKPVRKTPPLSKGHVELVLGHADPDYDPKNNLMSNNACRISQHQKSVIEAGLIEQPYVDDDVLVLLFVNPDSKEGGLTTGAPLPTSVSLDSHNKRQVFYEKGPNQKPIQTAVFRTADIANPTFSWPSLAGGFKVTVDEFWKDTKEGGFGAETIEMINIFLLKK
jgi:hypothetical protein